MTYPVGSITGFIRIAGAAQAQRDIAGVRASMAGAGESATAAAAGIRSTEGALASAGRSASAASAGTAKYRAAQLSAIAATERYNLVLADEDASLARLAAAEATVIRANERLRATTPVAAIAPVAPQAERAAGAMSRFGAGMASAGKMAVGLGVTLGAFELAKKAVEFTMAGRDLTTALNSVQAAAHATDAEMGPVRDQVIGLGHDLTVPGATAVDAATAIDDLVRAGMTLPRAMAAARSALLLMSVTQTDSAMSARVLGDALDEFRLPATEAAHVASMLGGAATASAGGLTSIFDAMKFAGSRARAAKIPMSDLLASIVDLSKAGIQGTIAGTGLGMVIAKLASGSPATVKALQDLGISAWDAQGKFKGLPFVVQSVTDAAKRFGPNSKQFLGDLQAAFGARAGNIMAAFAGKGIEGIDRFQKRIDSFDLQGAANKMNRGFGAAMAQITKQLTALGIDFYQKVEPALTSAAMWLGTSIPRAISTLGDILGPTVQMIGTGLAGAWRAVVAVLGPTASALGSIGHFLAQNNGLVKDAATAVLVMWGAWKGVAVATAALSAVNAGLTGLITRAQIAGDRMAMIGRGTATMGMQGFALALAAAGVAVYALGKAISSWIEGSRASVAVMDSLGGAVRSWQSALNAANGALDENVAKSVAAQLQANGLADKAHAAGISLNELTYGVTHGGKAFDQLVASWKAGGKPSDDTISAAKAMAIVFANTQSKALDLASVNGKLATTNQISATAMEHSATAARAAASATTVQAQAYHLVVGASGNLVQTTSSVAAASKKATDALNAQTAASRSLKLAEDLLNNVNESAESSTNAFQISLGNLRNASALARDSQGNLSHSMKQTTVAGASNRQMLVGVIDAAKSQAQAIADLAYKHGHTLTDALIKGNSQLAKNETAIRSAAAAAGLDKDQTDKLINSLGIVSKVHAIPKVSLDDQASGPTAAVHDRVSALGGLHPSPTVSIYDNASGRIDSIRGSLAALNGAVYTAYVNVQQRVLGPPIPHAGGTGPSGLPRGWSTVGEQGWEAAYTDDSGRTHIVPHAAAMKILNLPDRIPGYAGGTPGGSVPGFADGTQTIYGPLNSGVKGVAEILKMQTPAAKQAMKDLSAAVNDAFTLKGVQSQLASAKQALADMAAKVSQLRGSVTSALTGAFDPTKYGSVTDLLGGISSATAANKSYAADVAHASKYGLDKTFLSHLEASGNSATLDVLGHASKAQLEQVSKAMVAYRGSVIGAGNVAIAASGLTTSQATVNALIAKQDALVNVAGKLIAAVSQLTGHPTQLTIDGKVLAHTVIQPAVVAVIDELGHIVKYGRH